MHAETAIERRSATPGGNAAAKANAARQSRETSRDALQVTSAALRSLGLVLEPNFPSSETFTLTMSRFQGNAPGCIVSQVFTEQLA
jgi:hypothetical protein